MEEKNIVEQLAKEKTIYRINHYLDKQGYERIFSIYLDDYNKTNLYICFSFIKKQSIYKITWFDLKMSEKKKISTYLNVQMVNKNISYNIINTLSKVDIPEEIISNDDIIGDRVYINIKRKNNELSYGFTRFLPLEWKSLIDPIVLVFTYLPRNMEAYLNEMFAIYDGTTDVYTYTKPIKFDLLKTNPTKIFPQSIINLGTKYYASSRVLFLEEIENKYYAIIDDREPHFVILNQIDKNHTMMWCNCQKGYLCSHIYASLLALRHKNFNSFYKVKYNGDNLPLLDKIMINNVYLCYGISDDTIQLININGETLNPKIKQKGRVVFEVIEDDDNCSLSKILDEFKNK